MWFLGLSSRPPATNPNQQEPKPRMPEHANSFYISIDIIAKISIFFQKKIGQCFALQNFSNRSACPKFAPKFASIFECITLSIKHVKYFKQKCQKKFQKIAKIYLGCQKHAGWFFNKRVNRFKLKPNLIHLNRKNCQSECDKIRCISQGKCFWKAMHIAKNHVACVERREIRAKKGQ